MDFVSDQLAAGRKFRNLTIVDDFTRECLAIEVDTSLGGWRVARFQECQAGRPAHNGQWFVATKSLLPQRWLGDPTVKRRRRRKTRPVPPSRSKVLEGSGTTVTVPLAGSELNS